MGSLHGAGCGGGGGRGSITCTNKMMIFIFKFHKVINTTSNDYAFMISHKNSEASEYFCL